MIKWISEIGIAILLTLLILAVYAYQVSMGQILLTETYTDTVKFINKSKLVRTILSYRDLWEITRIYVTEFRDKIGLTIKPAFNITIYPSDGYVSLCVTTWSSQTIPFLKYKITRIILGSEDISSLEYGEGEVIRCTKTNVHYSTTSIYVILIKYYRLATFTIIAPRNLVLNAYDPYTDLIYNETKIEKVYTIIPFYSKPVEASFEKRDEGTFVEYEYGTVAFIVFEVGRVYITYRFPFNFTSGSFTPELEKYVHSEYYTFYISCGRR